MVVIKVYVLSMLCNVVVCGVCRHDSSGLNEVNVVTGGQMIDLYDVFC